MMGKLVFFEDGFEFAATNPKTDYAFILYKKVRGLCAYGVIIRIQVGHKTSRYIEISLGSTEAAKDGVQDLRKHVRMWLERNAAQREEERAFRASLLAQLGKLTERISFDPDIGDEALDAVERCKKRAREGGE